MGKAKIKFLPESGINNAAPNTESNWSVILSVSQKNLVGWVFLGRMERGFCLTTTYVYVSYSSHTPSQKGLIWDPLQLVGWAFFVFLTLSIQHLRGRPHLAAS